MRHLTIFPLFCQGSLYRAEFKHKCTTRRYNEKHPLTHYPLRDMPRLTYYDRVNLALWRTRTKLPLRQLAVIMHHDHSVLSRELQRNKGDHMPYHPDRAQAIADRRARKKRVCKLDIYPALYRYVEDRLKEEWSPEQIAGCIRETAPPELAGVRISHESIYAYIYEGNGKHWFRYLRKKHYARRKKQGRRTQTKTLIKERISIHCRPPEVATRTSFGHWESDSMIFSKQKAGISVQYERTSQLCRITRIENRSSEETKNALLCTIESLPSLLFKTMTFDNGGEGACHRDIWKDYGIATYFCDPYSSWQKGGVENMNGLIRQYLPRTTDLSTLTDRDLYEIQEKINNRPRKGLRYRSPNTVIKEYLETVHC